MQGFVVLHPMGWDAFGLPTERYAIKTGAHPAETTKKNAQNYKRQMNLMGLSYDWDREIFTTDPEYYKWTQLIFLRLYNAWFDTSQQKARPIDELPIPVPITKRGAQAVNSYKDQHRLVYYGDSIVNWCPQLNSVVANEEVMHDGRTEHGFEVIRKPMRQVTMRITAYAERLLAGLESLDWPESIKEQQRVWIGRTEGIEIRFSDESETTNILVFTTRPDTIFGVTFLAIAPEHAALHAITTAEYKKVVSEYVQKALKLGERGRKQQTEKTGVFTGCYVQNPLSKEKVPVFVSDYVLMEHGTGAVMGVPAHDQRDFDFAKKYDLTIRPTFAPPEGEQRRKVLTLEVPWVDDALALDLDDSVFKQLNLVGKSTKDVAQIVTEHLSGQGLGRKVVHYRIRDWVFSRQRYWGDPIPLIHWEDGTIGTVPEEELPLTLPILDDYKPLGDGKSALARAEQWVNVTDPKTGRKGHREVSTMPQWAGSCWYPLRFMDPHNANWIVAPTLEELWGPVDLYIGGAEHATLHLLYARFWYLAMFDLGLIKTQEPFTKLVNQGMLTGFAYKTRRGVIVPIDDVEEAKDEKYYIKKNSEHYDPRQSDTPLEKVEAKMSKSLHNVVNPDDVIGQYGADSFRVFLMFMAPVEGGRQWETKNVVGAERFLGRIWSFITDGSQQGHRSVIPEDDEDLAVRRAINTTVKGVAEDCRGLKLNTAISKIMICLNEISKYQVSLTTLKKLVLVLAPFAPFTSEELWQRLGHEHSLAFEPWPSVDEEAISNLQSVDVIITVNGKKREVLSIAPDCTDEALKSVVAQKLSSTKWSVAANDRLLVIRDNRNNFPKMVNVVKA
jgi:leucyl-tRNA synthetase